MERSGRLKTNLSRLSLCFGSACSIVSMCWEVAYAVDYGFQSYFMDGIVETNIEFTYQSTYRFHEYQLHKILDFENEIVRMLRFWKHIHAPIISYASGKRRKNWDMFFSIVMFRYRHCDKN